MSRSEVSGQEALQRRQLSRSSCLSTTCASTNGEFEAVDSACALCDRNLPECAVRRQQPGEEQSKDEIGRPCLDEMRHSHSFGHVWVGQEKSHSHQYAEQH